jgi:hypothetical protein
MHNQLEQVDVSRAVNKAPTVKISVMEDIGGQYLCGDISIEVAKNLFAIHIAEHSNNFMPESYVEPSNSLCSYIYGRTKGSSEYNKFFSEKTGEWLLITRATILQNETDETIYREYYERLLAIGSKDKACRIKELLYCYEKIKLPNEKLFEAALEAQQLDSSERRSKQRD